MFSQREHVYPSTNSGGCVFNCPFLSIKIWRIVIGEIFNSVINVKKINIYVIIVITQHKLCLNNTWMLSCANSFIYQDYSLTRAHLDCYIVRQKTTNIRYTRKVLYLDVCNMNAFDQAKPKVVFLNGAYKQGLYFICN